jgi:hypothetical protein
MIPLIFRTWSTNKAAAGTQDLIADGSSLKIDFQFIQGQRLAGDTSTGLWKTAGAATGRLISSGFSGLA